MNLSVNLHYSMLVSIRLQEEAKGFKQPCTEMKRSAGEPLPEAE